MTRILVTGGTGLVGRHAVRALLARGDDVHVLSREPGSAEAGLHWHAGDLLAADTPERIAAEVRADLLLHLAWTTEHGAFWSDPRNDDWADASWRLIRAFAGQGGRRCVVAGTCAEYDWNSLDDRGLCDDRTTPIAPATPYGQAKVALHRRLADFADEAGLSFGWGRLFFLYGAGEQPGRLVASVSRALSAGQEARCSSGTQRRDFMDARDAGAAFAALLTSPVEGPVNIATGQARSIAEIARTLAEIAGRPDLLRLGALPDQADAPPVLVAVVERLRREVGFVPAIALRQGLADALASWGGQRKESGR